MSMLFDVPLIGDLDYGFDPTMDEKAREELAKFTKELEEIVKLGENQEETSKLKWQENLHKLFGSLCFRSKEQVEFYFCHLYGKTHKKLW